jgi:hypothetical protein
MQTWLPLQRLNEEVNDAAACEAYSKRIVVGIAKRNDATGLFAAQNC